MSADRRLRKEKTLKPASSSSFPPIFYSVLGLTLVSLAVCVYLTIQVQNPSSQVIGLIEACSTTWKMGFGAVVALMSVRKA